MSDKEEAFKWYRLGIFNTWSILDEEEIREEFEEEWKIQEDKKDE